MNRRISNAVRRDRWAGLLALLCACATIAAGPLPTGWRQWRYSRPIELPPTGFVRLVSLAVPQEVYLHAAPYLTDVRIVDDSGVETPYVLRRREQIGNFTPTFIPVILENSFSPGNYTQLVLDLRNHNAFYSSMQIETTETEFMEWVEADASDDANVWRIVQERAPIFRFPQEGHAGTNVVHYSSNNARYLRLRVLDGNKKFPVTRVPIVAAPAVQPQREQFFAWKLVPTKPNAPNQSAWDADLGSSHAPLREVRFQVGPGEFVREVTIQSSRDGSNWFFVGSGEIFRFKQGDRECQELTVAISGSPERFLRVEIANGNDQPLSWAVPTIYIAAQRIVFQQQPGRSYRLLYGQTQARPPQYDLARRLNEPRMDAAPVVQVGAEEVTVNWSDPRPWTEVHSFVAWIGVVLAVVLLAFTAIQSLRRSTNTNSSG